MTNADFEAATQAPLYAEYHAANTTEAKAAIYRRVVANWLKQTAVKPWVYTVAQGGN